MINAAGSHARRTTIRIASAVMTAATVIAMSGCVSPSRTTEDYQHKAANTAEAMISAVASAELAGHAYLDGKAFGPFTSVNVTDAESDADSIMSTFDSVQPPNADADALKDRLDTAMQDATSALTDLRIAVRRNHQADTTKALDDLAKAKSDLEKIEQVA